MTDVNGGGLIGPEETFTGVEVAIGTELFDIAGPPLPPLPEIIGSVGLVTVIFLFFVVVVVVFCSFFRFYMDWREGRETERKRETSNMRMRLVNFLPKT